MPEMSPSTPSIAMPASRNGIRRIQTSGYTIAASRATGQQSTSRMHQSRNFTTPAHTIWSVNWFGEWAEVGRQVGFVRGRRRNNLPIV